MRGDQMVAAAIAAVTNSNNAIIRRYQYQRLSDEAKPAYHNHNQCDQVGRFFTLWATF